MKNFLSLEIVNSDSNLDRDIAGTCIAKQTHIVQEYCFVNAARIMRKELTPETRSRLVALSCAPLVTLPASVREWLVSLAREILA